MLSAERNAFMTRVGRGEPMGELFRRFWLPLTLSEQLGEPDGEPVRLRLLGEDLVAFRDTTGTVGVVSAFCPHRRAPLFFGRNEEAGLRCVYHGWKFDTTGACVDMPSEPPDSDFKERVRVRSYPAREFGDTVWVYMGPGEPPPLPLMEWATIPAAHRRVAMWIVECNWLQVLEGNVDTAHVSFLHSANDGIPGVREEGLEDRAPQLQVIENNIGFAYAGRRKRQLDEQYYWRVTRRINYSGIQGIETQDRAMTEGMGYVCDRTEEHLGSSDLAVIALRRILERRAQELQQGQPPQSAELGAQFGVRPLDILAPEANLGDLLARHADEVRMAVTIA